MSNRRIFAVSSAFILAGIAAAAAPAPQSPSNGQLHSAAPAVARPVAAVVPERAVVDKYPRRLPQCARQGRQPQPPGARYGGRRRERRNVGEGGPQAARWPDAAGWRGASRGNELPDVPHDASDRARPGRGRRPESRAHRDSASAEPDRGRELGARFAWRRDGARICCRPTIELRVRQHRRRTEDVAGADGALSGSGEGGQPLRGREPAAGARDRHLPRLAGDRAARSPRRSAVRHPRRHADSPRLPARRAGYNIRSPCRAIAAAATRRSSNSRSTARA